MANTDLILSLPNKDVDSYFKITSGTVAWAFGDWYEIDAGIRADIAIIGFTYQRNSAIAVDTTVEALYEIQTGDGGNWITQIQLPLSVRNDTAVGYYLNQTIFFPEGFLVPAGQAIRIRVARSIATAGNTDGIRLLYTSAADNAYSPADIYPNNYKRFGGSAIVGGN